ncbi:hypothetical protein Cgig2_023764 [Carnegiea gigantea]|uniref:Uncharacterized protein n=1 Tax=Carnegiea gigantea TaxID=171969 RepID=A0A9Q1KCI9_9CARY|nr:hypothetical protein Cgig2_023764 [Carnegiea gigantea]
MVKITNALRVMLRWPFRRWSKGIKEIESNDLIIEDGMKDTPVCSSVWRMQMGKKVNALLTASQVNREARLLCEEYFSKLKELIEVQVGSAINLKRKKSAEVRTKIVTGVQESSENGVPVCMNVPYGGANPEGNVVSTSNMLSNSNSNDQTLRQSTITPVGYYSLYYVDPRSVRGLTPMIFQSFIGQTPINSACN